MNPFDYPNPCYQSQTKDIGPDFSYKLITKNKIGSNGNKRGLDGVDLEVGVPTVSSFQSRN